MAEKTLDQKIQEAKAAGYTDEEIQSYLNPKPIEQPKEDKRSEEYAGTGEFGAAKAAQYGLEAGGAYYGGKKLLQAAGNAFRGGAPTPTPTPAPVAPTPVAPAPAAAPAPTTFTGGANPAWDEALSKPFNPAAPQGAPAQPPVGGPAAQQGSTFLQRFGQQLGQMRQSVAPIIEQAATKALPIARGATAIGATIMPGNVGQNYGAHFPQTGPMRGMEINPQTGRPWTAQELQAYSQQY